MIENDISIRKSFNPWHFIWITVVVSELFTAIISTIQHTILPVAELKYVLRIGAIDSLFVPLIVAPILIYFTRSESALKKLNMQLVAEIAERNRTEDALRESEISYRGIINSFGEAVYILDGAGTFLDVNFGAERMYGYSREDLIGKSFLSLSAKDSNDFDFVMQQCFRAYNGAASNVEFWGLAKDGRVFPQEVHLYPGTYFGRNVIIAIAEDVTDRKRAERLIADAYEFNRNILETSPIGIATYKASGQCVMANEAAAKIVGTTTERMLSQDFNHIASWERSGLLAAAKMALEDHKVVSQEAHLTTTFGKECWLDCRLTSFTASGERHLILFGIDITERKRAEELLRRSEERLRLAMIASRQGWYDLNVQTGEVMVSDEYALLLGYEPSEFRTDLQNWTHGLHPEDREGLLKAFQDALITGDVRLMEYRRQTKSGEWKWLRSTGKIVSYDADKRPLRMIGTHVDISEQKQAEESLQASEAHFKKVVEHIPIAMSLVNSDGVIEYYNQKAIETFGYLPQDIPNLDSWWVRAYPDKAYREEVIAQWMDLVSEARKHDHEIEQREYRVTCKDGKVKIVAIFGVWIADKVLTIFDDITGRKLADEEKRALEQERLKSQKLESIGTLAGGIAHDFNNLLQGVFGYISLAKLKKNDQAKSMAALEEAEKALHMSVRLTNQLLTFSKGGKPVMTTLDLRSVIENAAKFSLSGSRNDYRISFDDDIWQVEADEGQISQVIQNIVLNADQAMPEGGQVIISVRNVGGPGPGLPQGLGQGKYVKIAIKDTGIGISEKYLGRIFDPYFTTKEKGSGLGLATSYSIIKNHNGFIEVRSELDKGTTFIIYLHAASAVRKAEQTMISQALTGRTGRVLVMDDEAIILDVAGELIKALGHEAQFATNGGEAIELYKQAQKSGQSFDVVILDLTIRGGMGGAETLRKLLAINPNVKAAVSSGYSDDALIAGYREQGFKAVLKKPYNIGELRDVINRLLSR